ncbi:MAG: YqgE/AlgH family protein [Flavobacteriales bacterium]|nr:YqgE/AlgH family protein [Flavobacteriales bacterium]
MEITDIFKLPEQKIKAKAGRLLISEPFMQDPYFKRSVVLLTEHNERGSFGLILNKPIPMYLNEAIENAPRFDSKLALGGPVQKETLHYLHLLGNKIPNSTEVMDGIYWGGDFETVKELIISGDLRPNNIRMFVGYSGWAEGQLNHEMESKSWIVAKASKELLFGKKPEKLWSEILKQMGGPYEYMVKLPEDPRLN